MRDAAATDSSELAAVTMNRSRRCGPPSMQAKHGWSVSTSSTMPPPSATRKHTGSSGSATQTLPSASRQMPSGGRAPRSAQTRRLCSVPSLSMSNAVSCRRNVSARIIVRPSGVMTVPLGNLRPSAATLTVPSGSTRASLARGGPGSPSASSTPCSRRNSKRSKPKLPT